MTRAPADREEVSRNVACTRAGFDGGERDDYWREEGGRFGDVLSP